MKGISYRDRDYSFGEAMLALRTKVGLTQAGLAQQLGISRRAVGAWEVGASYPSPKHLKHLIELGSQHRAFHPGQEAEEIRLLWASAKLRVPLDETWLAGLLEQALDQPTAPHSSSVGMELSKPRSHVDWGDAPEVSNFYGRENERVFLTEWLLVEHCRVVDAELAGTVLAEAFHFPSSVALSGDGALLAAGTLTGQVWLWRVADRPLLWAMQAQTGAVWGMALSADGQLVASASLDGTVKLWGAKSGACLRTLRAERRYERMDITGLLGVTAAQRAPSSPWERWSGPLIRRRHTGVRHPAMANGEVAPIVAAAQEKGPGLANIHRNMGLVHQGLRHNRFAAGQSAV